MSNIVPDYLGHAGVLGSLGLNLAFGWKINFPYGDNFPNSDVWFFLPSWGSLMPSILKSNLSKGLHPFLLSWVGQNLHKKFHSSLALWGLFSTLACILGDFLTGHKACLGFSWSNCFHPKMSALFLGATAATFFRLDLCTELLDINGYFCSC